MQLMQQNTALRRNVKISYYRKTWLLLPTKIIKVYRFAAAIALEVELL
jgi:hypothetical protein